MTAPPNATGNVRGRGKERKRERGREIVNRRGRKRGTSGETGTQTRSKTGAGRGTNQTAGGTPAAVAAPAKMAKVPRTGIASLSSVAAQLVKHHAGGLEAAQSVVTGKITRLADQAQGVISPAAHLPLSPTKNRSRNLPSGAEAELYHMLLMPGPPASNTEVF